MTHRNRRKALRGPLLAVALVGVFAGTAFATPAIQFVGTPLARGTLDQAVQYNVGDIKFQTKGAVVFNVVSIAVAPGGTSGWHTHPGIVLVTVKAGGGAITFYHTDCSSTVHAAGTSFTESDGDGPGLARNEGATEAILYVTFIAPAGTTVFRNDAANPGCPQN